MTPLHKKILERAQFDHQFVAKKFDQHGFSSSGGFSAAQRVSREENARLLPIISSLLEANQRLMYVLELIGCGDFRGDRYKCTCTRCKALTANADLLERIAGGGG